MFDWDIYPYNRRSFEHSEKFMELLRVRLKKTCPSIPVYISSAGIDRHWLWYLWKINSNGDEKHE